MAHIISFRTGLFDPASEPENPINPIAGQSALVWLRKRVLGQVYEATEPDYEDWGWYIEVHGDGATYTVGAICFDEDREPNQSHFEWMIQVVKRRRVFDVLRGRNAMTVDDELTATISDALRADPAFEGVTVEFEG